MLFNFVLKERRALNCLKDNLDNNVDSQACFSIEVNIDENLSSNLDNIDFSEINIEEYLGKEGIDLSIFDSL